MEVTKPDYDGLVKLVTEWRNHPEQELEATIGHKGTVSATAFMDILKRLRNKGYKPLPQEDRLNILLPNSMRFTIAGIGQIQQYCRTNILAGKPFSAMIKDRTGVEANVNLPEYDVRIKSRRELPMTNDDPRIAPVFEHWDKQDKAFRMIRRWSFLGDGARFDLSMVRSSLRDTKKGSYRYVRTFQEHNFLKEPPTYEVEVELLRDEEEDIPVARALAILIKSIGEVLRGLQRNSILIRKTMREATIEAYKTLVRNDRFRGVQPVTLAFKNMEALVDPKVPNIRNGYNVTDKADGLRVLAMTDEQGELFLIDMNLNVYRSGLRLETLKNSLLDGEWVTRDRDGNALNQLMLFDIYYDREGQTVEKLPFVDAAGQGRYKHLQDWVAKWNEDDGPGIVAKGITESNKMVVGIKTFLFGKAGDTSIFAAAEKILAIPTPYHTDGLIFTPNDTALPPLSAGTFAAQFKWKPAQENTIDFLVNYEKSPDNVTEDKVVLSINPENGELLRYKVLRLQVGASYEPAYSDPRATILNDMPLPTAPFRPGGAGAGPAAKPEYKPVLFNPSEYPDTMANICNGSVILDLETGDELIMTEEGEQILDNSIVEMRYDPSKPPGWRWVAMRIRHDKTERLQRKIYSRTMNAERTANSIWESIHEPITHSMITTGAETPTAEELATLVQSQAELVGKKYYDRRSTPQVDLLHAQGLRAFHNRWIKERILLNTTMREGDKRLIDFTCGEAGDLQKWIRLNARFVLGVDVAGEGIRNPRQGAYRRYMDALVREGRENVPNMVFAIADSSLPLTNGEAGATPEEADILRAVFGKFAPEGAIPSYIDRVAAGQLENGADIATCMFSLHYFFETRDKFEGLLRNINDTLAVGGYFVGCSFDGDKVFDMLAPLPADGVKQGRDGDKLVWSIKKRYGQLELPDTDAAFGMGIDVDFITIGQTHTEYLVPFKLLVKKLKTIGLELLTDEEARALMLVQSTNMFDVSYKMATKAGQKFPMSEALREFSFLNRWYIFKRRSLTPVVADPATLAEIEAAADAAAKQAAEIQVAEAGSKAAAAAAKLPKSAAALREKEKAQQQAKLLSALPEEAVAASIEAAASPEVKVTKKVKKAAAAAAEEGEGEAASAAAPVAVLARKAAAAVAEGEEEGAAASAAAPRRPATKTYASAQVFTFFAGAPEIKTKAEDVLGIKDKDKFARSRLTTISPFMVQDQLEDGTVVEYPSVEHYMAAMRMKKCGRNPDKARRLFSRNGTIHEEAKGQRRLAGISERTYAEFQNSLKEEQGALYRALREAKLMTVECDAVANEALREGMRQRLERDAPFKAVVQKALAENKYLLNFDPVEASDMGGKRMPSGKIQGNNRVGKVIMDLAGIPY